MGKIKGWRKSGENVWFNDNINYVVEIIKPNIAGYHVQVFEWGNHRDTFRTLNHDVPFKSKKTAERVAKQYMRLHPNG